MLARRVPQRIRDDPPLGRCGDALHTDSVEDMTKPGSRLSRSLAFGVATGLTSLPAYDKISTRNRRRIIGWGSLAGALATGGAMFAASRRGVDSAGADAVGAAAAAAPASVPAADAPAPSATQAARPKPPLQQQLAATAGLALAGGAATAGALWFSFWADRQAMQFLRKRGVRAPRVWLAGGGAVLGAALEFMDQAKPVHSERNGQVGTPDPTQPPGDAEGAPIFSAS